MSNSVWPHRWQPTMLPRPWDSPGKNNGVGCHFLLQCMKVKSESEVTQSCPTLTLRDPMDCSPPGSSVLTSNDEQNKLWLQKSLWKVTLRKESCSCSSVFWWCWTTFITNFKFFTFTWFALYLPLKSLLLWLSK